MSVRLFTLLVFLPFSAAAVLPQAEEEVEAEEGDDVILKCQLDPEDDVRKSPVTWSKDERKNIVHVYRLGQDHAEDQKEVFRNRTVLHHEGLKKGNVTLQLFSVRLSDNGRFICYIRRLDAYCYVILKVVRRGQLNRSVGSVVSTATSQPEVEPGGKNKTVACVDVKYTVISIFVGVLGAVILVILGTVLIYKKIQKMKKKKEAERRPHNVEMQNLTSEGREGGERQADAAENGSGNIQQDV
ncbi:selection and upkeep of intraepithelial T-cells protein 1-like isoform X2 [Anabas testudineus]|uniref:selection and upkeep of intraepithelial T-cells protein 1-like isoform X2 n=1 Tax=Anabas testudineus TaxID=64144 RepID=UPI000E461798|nr:selection and upkeep of intraepithelial T-cells protein 1-like isoform X2 [Anabas testudineus]